ncbi:MAG: 6-bladed beta-propeller [Saprospiraceae bacterium]|nr:6-bladed beta-propeller [Saprospiraceae bacterium]
MRRRDFLFNTSLGVAGALYMPKLLLQNDTILGHNQKRYRLNARWSQADVSRYPVKDCHEMVQDQKGRILLLTNETHNNVLIYDKNGQILDAWGTEYPGAHGFTLFNENGTDVLFICDNTRHQVIKTTIDGRVLLTLDYPKETGQYTKPEEYVPTETAIAANGDIYVADGYGKDFIIQYDTSGRYIRHFGGRGEGPEHLLNAHGVCIDTRDPNLPCLLVCSRQQNALKRFDFEGNYLSTIELPGAWVCRPVIHGEYLYAAVLQSSSLLWKQSGFVTILDKQNKVVSNLAGTQPTYADGKLQEMSQTMPVFVYPHDVCIDDEENLYVAQWNSGKTYPYKLEPVP